MVAEEEIGDEDSADNRQRPAPGLPGRLDTDSHGDQADNNIRRFRKSDVLFQTRHIDANVNCHADAGQNQKYLRHLGKSCLGDNKSVQKYNNKKERQMEILVFEITKDDAIYRKQMISDHTNGGDGQHPSNRSLERSEH